MHQGKVVFFLYYQSQSPTPPPPPSNFHLVFSVILLVIITIITIIDNISPDDRIRPAGPAAHPVGALLLAGLRGLHQGGEDREVQDGAQGE